MSILTPWLSEVYGLQPMQPIEEEAKQGAIKFKKGIYSLAKGGLPIEISQLSFFPAGIGAQTSHSTEACETFLVDLFTRLAVTFGVLEYREVIQRKRYFSQVWVNTDKNIELLNPKLKAITEYLSSEVEEGKLKFEAGGISFWPDQTAKFPPSAFVFERAGNIPFSENRYFSRAPLTTDKHLHLLEMLENILA